MVIYEDHFADPDMVYGSIITLEYSEGGTRLAMPKTRLRAGLTIIEAWFRGY